VDPFDVYRALRAVNPSPYMVYLQAEGCILVASSPEILCRVRHVEGRPVVTNRPLAGTRKRGATEAEDQDLERDLLADQKERAEHVMLVDLGRNDVGRVAKPGTIDLPAVMEIERYSHVMHISSTVTGELREGLDAWDALAAALPVGTISGAPKIRAMQIIDELEPVRRGPYGGGMGYIGLDGDMDIALALRTMVVPTSDTNVWTYHLQASGGIVADSQHEAEFQETINKAAALARAIDLAEAAFLSPDPS
ncbi:MAG: chorismate-binding protein, partial [Phycisphaerales bacterium]|nr:chorismate-binding protein [Phycisphaerales bacterium]